MEYSGNLSAHPVGEIGYSESKHFSLKAMLSSNDVLSSTGCVFDDNHFDTSKEDKEPPI